MVEFHDVADCHAVWLPWWLGLKCAPIGPKTAKKKNAFRLHFDNSCNFPSITNFQSRKQHHSASISDCFKFEFKLLLSLFSVTSVESISRLSLRFSHCWERLVRELLGHRSRVTSSHGHLATVERTTFEYMYFKCGRRAESTA